MQILTLWLMAAAADALLGGIPGLRPVLEAPTTAVRALGAWFDRRLNRPQRSVANRRVRGAIVVLVVVVLAWVAALLASGLASSLPSGRLVEAFFVLCLIDQRRAIDRVRGTARALTRGDLGVARARLRYLGRYDTGALDVHAAARAGVEAAARRFASGVVGAAFWYVVGGLPGLAIYRAVEVLADRIARPDPDGAAFGATAARLEGMLTLPPALIAGPLMALAALFVPGAKPGAAFAEWLRDATRRLGDGAGRAEGALAGALGLALGGPRPFEGGTAPGPWVGDGRARAVAADVQRAAAIFIVACLMAAVLAAMLLMLRVR